MTRSEMEDEMEEGELPEEGELVDNDDALEKEKKQNKTSKGASDIVQTSAKTNAKEETRNEISTEGGEGDVKEFIKKKRKELAEKVKSQLLAGVESRLGGGSVTDEDNDKKKRASQSENAASEVSPSKGSKSKKKSPSPSAAPLYPKSESGHSSSKYRDLDKLQTTDPTETMMSNWLRRGNRKPSLLDSPTGQPMDEQADPNEEYYGISGAIKSPSPIDTGATGGVKDQDYRLNSGGDQDYRLPPSQPAAQFDVDYRREHTRRRQSDDDVAEFGDRSSDARKKSSLLPSGPSGTPADVNEFGDIDERFQSAAGGSSSASRYHDRRSKRSHSDDSGSGSDDEGHGRSSKKRRRSPPPSGRGRRGGGPSGWWGGGERPVCKFFREGYCREGDNCNFSHDLEPSWKPAEKRSELCRFYLSGYCRNGRRCPYLHGEFPCKDFHKGDCSKGDECRFSHEPLNDVTKPLFEQMLKDEELAAKVSVPNAKSTRKVLLGAPPPPMPMNMSPPHASRMSPPIIHPPMGNQMRQGFRSPSPPPYFHPPTQFDQFGPNPGPPPFFNNAPMPGRGMSPPYGPGPCGPPNMGFMQPNHPPMEPFLPPFVQPQQQPNPLPMDHGAVSGADNVSMHMTAMLRKIRAEMTEGDVEESPASPEPSAEPMDVKSNRPRTIAHVVYRLIPVDVPPINRTAVAALLQASLTDTKLRNDPRIKRLLQSQFNAGSDMTLHPTKDGPQRQSIAQQPQSRDPRSRAARDPRLSRQQQNNSSVSAPAPAPVIEMFQQPIPPLGADQSSTRFDTAAGFGMNMLESLGGAPGPGPFFPTPPNSGFNAQAAPLMAPGGWMPQVNLINANTPVASLAMPSYLDPIPQQFPPSMPPQQLVNGPPRSSPPQLPIHHYSGPMMADSPPASDPRSGRRRDYFPPIGNGGSHGLDKSEQSDEAVQSTNSGAAQHENVLSLRERRKDLQYESPLSEKSNSAADEAKYNPMLR